MAITHVIPRCVIYSIGMCPKGVCYRHVPQGGLLSTVVGMYPQYRHVPRGGGEGSVIGMYPKGVCYLQCRHVPLSRLNSKATDASAPMLK